MATLAKFYDQYRKRLSIKGFMRIVGQPYWRLRDYLHHSARRKQQDQRHSQAVTAILEVVHAQPTYGYRRVYHHLRQQRTGIRGERVRRLMDERGLRVPAPMRKRRPTPRVSSRGQYPSRPQRAVTRVSVLVQRTAATEQFGGSDSRCCLG